jgi:hypothetical protein
VKRALRKRAPIIAYLILVLALILTFVRVEDVRQERRQIANEAIVASCERVDRVLGELVRTVANPNVDPNKPDHRFQHRAKDALRALREQDCQELGRRATDKSEGE